MSKIVVISCSNTDIKKSINYDLANKIATMGSFDFINLVDYQVDYFSNDIMDNVPDKIKELSEKINQYNELILVTPEINGYLPSFAKNIFDWLSLNKKWLTNKKAYVLSATPGMKGGPKVRRLLSDFLGYFGAEIFGSVGFSDYQLNQDRKKEIQEFVNSVISNS
ncbi:NAD(P)H-dependent oxidoreductase [Mycoplasma bradburyae]|uniref:NAD(P)H-dependent oxidoreductase n=1 Tax=Mycoplasma bradburyae TaxID=2963128 RepID=UPI0023428341|nr:NAD(P)H-dependent oxidoreductase [Mycoplasma bradburyae]MDC4184106.1 NAD(P)H-dependent oxidoreductase [Mycoplasma bradburyae]